MKNRHLKFEKENSDKINKDALIRRYKGKLNLIYKQQNELKRKYKVDLNLIYKRYNELQCKHDEYLNLICKCLKEKEGGSTTRSKNRHLKFENENIHKIDKDFLIRKYKEELDKQQKTFERKHQEKSNLTRKYHAELECKHYEEINLLNLIRKHQENGSKGQQLGCNSHPKLELENENVLNYQDFLNVKYPEREYPEPEREYPEREDYLKYLKFLKNRHLKPENEDGDR